MKRQIDTEILLADDFCRRLAEIFSQACFLLVVIIKFGGIRDGKLVQPADVPPAGEQNSRFSGYQGPETQFDRII